MRRLLVHAARDDDANDDANDDCATRRTRCGGTTFNFNELGHDVNDRADERYTELQNYSSRT